MYRTANPLLRLRDDARPNPGVDAGRAASRAGVVRRAWVLAFLVALSSLIPLQRAVVQRFSPEVLVALGLGIVMVYGAMIYVRRRAAPFASSFFAFGIGLAIGGFSAFVTRDAGGLIGIALLSTVAALIAALWTYSLHAHEHRSRRFIATHMCMASIFVLVASAALVQPFVERVSSWSGSANVAAALVGLIIVCSTICYMADMHAIDEGLAHDTPRAIEWYCAVGLVFTIIWLPAEMLRMVTKVHVWVRRGAPTGTPPSS